MGQGEIDMAEVQRDAAIIQALSTDQDLPIDAASDPVATLLQAWASELGRDLDAIAPFEMPAVPVLPFDETKPSAKRHGRVFVLAGATAAALVISSGAAAAMTGDPLAAVKAPLHVLSKVNPFDGADNARDTLPDVANPQAKPNKLLADAQRALAQGDTEEAARLLALAQENLGGNANPGQLHRIDHLQSLIDGNGQHGPATPGTGHGQAGEHGGKGGQPDDTGTPDDPGTPPDNAGGNTTNGNSDTGHANEPGSGQGKHAGSGQDAGGQQNGSTKNDGTHNDGTTGPEPKPTPSPSASDRPTHDGTGGNGGTADKSGSGGSGDSSGKSGKSDGSEQQTSTAPNGGGKKSAKRSGDKNHADAGDTGDSAGTSA